MRARHRAVGRRAFEPSGDLYHTYHKYATIRAYGEEAALRVRAVRLR